MHFEKLGNRKLLLNSFFGGTELENDFDKSKHLITYWLFRLTLLRALMITFIFTPNVHCSEAYIEFRKYFTKDYFHIYTYRINMRKIFENDLNTLANPTRRA